MRLRITDGSPCDMQPGQARRVPRDAKSELLGYILSCDACGRLTPIWSSDGTISESDDRSAVFSQPAQCSCCGAELEGAA